jgi:hypothetical protein
MVKQTFKPRYWQENIKVNSFRYYKHFVSLPDQSPTCEAEAFHSGSDWFLGKWNVNSSGILEDSMIRNWQQLTGWRMLIMACVPNSAFMSKSRQRHQQIQQTQSFCIYSFCFLTLISWVDFGSLGFFGFFGLALGLALLDASAIATGSRDLALPTALFSGIAAYFEFFVPDWKYISLHFCSFDATVHMIASSSAALFLLLLWIPVRLAYHFCWSFGIWEKWEILHCQPSHRYKGHYD